MPRYFFHVRDGRSGPDTEGIELTGRKEAWSLANRFMSEIIRDLGGVHAPGSSWCLEVMEESDRFCWRLGYGTKGIDPNG